jgi:hypothetical protein
MQHLTPTSAMPSAPSTCSSVRINQPKTKAGTKQQPTEPKATGTEEQAAEHAAGNKNAKNWHDEALKIVEDMVCYKSILLLIS